ncbi:peptidoglycan-binding protein LysM [Mangrovimicrobium sediminis]|uniref:Potassium binding protein Kbp n=1 Tax=Mangrovimicrobium sediminis TaxID=2562682 RepID=A0A4Z0LX63_9GAMM|nr:peptidoglycan-binding protein LysM [Haliea sp. SAOS-164]TGD71738.1 peptidoglycan-binding protein LysM [Haliea sp. SAOS-164]
MGLFDFIKTAGAEDLEKTVEVSAERVDELRQQAITKSIAALDIDGEKVKVAVKGEVATLTGTSPSQEALEKMVLCAGNQYGIASVDCQLTVDAPAAAPAAAEAPAAATAESRFYTVKSGDTLGAIAKEFYGDAGKYPVIFEANKPMLTDPNKIYPGQTLRIPEL